MERHQDRELRISSMYVGSEQEEGCPGKDHGDAKGVLYPPRHGNRQFRDWESRYGLHIVSETEYRSRSAYWKALTDPLLQLLEELGDRLPDEVEEVKPMPYVSQTVSLC